MAASGDEDWDVDSNYQLDEDQTALTRGRQPLGVTRRYVPSWRPQHGFREFYQNWKDAILESNELSPNDLCMEVHGFNARNIYTFSARHPDSSELLGYIRFDPKIGTIELANFKAQLSRSALNLGESTKRTSADAAGTHGEGFKVASLVMARNGYRVQFEASNFYWTMKFAGRDVNMLYCFLTPVAESKIAKQQEKYNAKLARGTPRDLQNNIWEDVSVKIGKVRGSGDKVNKADFVEWTKTCLDLDPPDPAKVIKTTIGVLILDERFKNKIYLKGLLLEDISGKPYQFGYNFFKGSVNRDRERMSDSAEEASSLAQLWTEAIAIDKKQTVEKFVSMLRENEVADVHGISKYVTKALAEKIWEELLRLDRKDELFYHDANSADKDIGVIQDSLRKLPRQLPNHVWAALRKFELVRTPREQQSHLLHNAETVEADWTPFSIGLQRALRAALALDQRAEGLEMVFKRGDKTDLDLLLTDKTLEINNKWLDFGKSHGNKPCWGASQKQSPGTTGSEHFLCDHIAINLYKQVLRELCRQNNRKDSSVSFRVIESIRHMPMSTTIKVTDQAGTIEVSWTDLDSNVAVYDMKGLSPNCRITLHRASICSADKTELLLQSSNKDKGLESEIQAESVACGCPSKIVPRKDFKVTFDGLDCQEHYFAIVSRNYVGAFLGVPSDTVTLFKTARPTVSSSGPNPSQARTSPINVATGGSRSSEAKPKTTPRQPRHQPNATRSHSKVPNQANKERPQIKETTVRASPEENIRDLKAEVSAQVDQLRASERANATLQQEVLDQRKAKELICDEKKQAELESAKVIDDLKASNLLLNNEKTNLTKELASGENLIDQLDAKIAQLNEEKTKVVRETRKVIDDLEAENRLLKDEKNRAALETSQEIDGLKLKVTELTSRAEEAEDDLAKQISITQNISQRRRGGSGKVKRERAEDGEHVEIKGEGSSKRQKTTPGRGGAVVDLTADDEDSPSRDADLRDVLLDALHEK